MSDKLADAFAQLCAVVRPRPDMTESNIEAGAARLYRVLCEYPEQIALIVLDVWPRRSEWFPTEFELREVLEEVASNAAHEAAQRGSVGDGRYRQPVGNAVAFVERVRDIRGDGYCKSWLAGGVTCLFTANHVYTTGVGADRLEKDFGELAQQLGVKIIFDRECSAMLARYCDANQLKFEPKRRRA